MAGDRFADQVLSDRPSAATSVPLPSISSTDAPERCAARRPQFADPLQIDRREDDPVDGAVVPIAGYVANRLGIWCSLG